MPAPVVVVTAPAACSETDADHALQMTADALSISGSIVRVEFFDGDRSVGVATSKPWVATLAQPSLGVHTITARATDDRGFSTTSRAAVVTTRAANVAPTVSIVTPSDATHVALGATLGLSATARDSDGSVARVEYRIADANGTLLGQATVAPFAASWITPASGSYTVVAIAIDDRGASGTSAPVHVLVDANVAPTVNLTSPSDGGSYGWPASVVFSASASDSDGSIRVVDFLANGAVVGSAAVAPYTATWSVAGPGSYRLEARATDDRGATSTSSSRTIIVAANAPPTVSLHPLDEPYFAPASITLGADAADPDGSVARVEFNANGALVGVSNAAPFTIVWANVPTGTYSVTATAVDNAGASSTTPPVTVSIGAPLDVSMAGGLDGATVADDNVLIRGSVSAPPNSAMSINGIVAHIDDTGQFHLNDLPLAPGTNTVNAVLTTQDGQTTSRSIILTSTGPGPFIVRAAPTEGLDTLSVTFTIENPSATPFARMSIDLDNNGLSDVEITQAQLGSGPVTFTATYPTGTWLAVVKAYDDQNRVIYSTSKSIVVLSPTILQANLRGIYDGMLKRLKGGNMQAALTALTGSARERYEPMLALLQPSLPSIVDQLGTVTEINFGIDIAEFSVVQAAPDGARRFMLYLIRSEDGIWRLDGM